MNSVDQANPAVKVHYVMISLSFTGNGIMQNRMALIPTHCCINKQPLDYPNKMTVLLEYFDRGGGTGRIQLVCHYGRCTYTSQKVM